MKDLNWTKVLNWIKAVIWGAVFGVGIILTYLSGAIGIAAGVLAVLKLPATYGVFSSVMVFLMSFTVYGFGSVIIGLVILFLLNHFTKNW